MTEGRGFRLLLWTRKHEPICRGNSQETQELGLRQWWGWFHRRGGGGEPSSPARTQGAERGRNSLFNFLSRIKVVCAHSRKYRKHRKRRKGKAGTSHCPTSYRRCEAAGKSSLLRAQRGQCSRNPRQKATPKAGSLGTGTMLQRSVTPGAFRARTQLGPCGGQGKMLGASDSKTRVSLLALQPGANGKTDWGRQRDASPDSGWAIFGNGSSLLHNCCLSAIGPTCICPPECSLQRPPPRLGSPASHNGVA